MQRILITGGRNPTALELVRLLHGSNTQIWLADSLYFSIGRYSRFVHQYVRTPRVTEDTPAYIAFLRNVIQKNHIDWLIPTYEESMYIARERHMLEDVCEVFCDTIDKLQLLHNKWSFVQQASSCSIKAPPTFFLESPADVELLRADARYYVFKPVYSRFATQLLINPGEESLQRLQESRHYPWVAQWYVQGPEFCSYSIVHHGEVKAHVSYQHPYNLGKGSGIYYQMTEQPALEQFVREFCWQHQYHGQIGFDFMLDEREKKFYVIECNPRTVNGLHLFSKQSQLLQAFAGTNAATIYPGSRQPRMNALTFITYNSLQALQRRRFGQWCRDLFKAKDVIFRWDDPLPMITQNLTLLEFIWRSLYYGISLSEAVSYDTVWNSQHTNIGIEGEGVV